MIDWLLLRLPPPSQLSLICALLAIAVPAWKWKVRGQQFALDRLVEAMMAGAGFPIGLYLIVCAFEPERVKMLAELGFYLLAAGVSVLYVSAKSLIRERESSAADKGE